MIVGTILFSAQFSASLPWRARVVQSIQAMPAGVRRTGGAAAGGPAGAGSHRTRAQSADAALSLARAGSRSTRAQARARTAHASSPARRPCTASGAQVAGSRTLHVLWRACRRRCTVSGALPLTCSTCWQAGTEEWHFDCDHELGKRAKADGMSSQTLCTRMTAKIGGVGANKRSTRFMGTFELSVAASVLAAVPWA